MRLGAAVGRLEQVRDNLRRAYVLTRASARARANQRAVDDDEDDDDLPVEPEILPPTNGGHASTTSSDDAEVPHGLRIAAAWSWRLLVLAIALAGALWL